MFHQNIRFLPINCIHSGLTDSTPEVEMEALGCYPSKLAHYTENISDLKMAKCLLPSSQTNLSFLFCSREQDMAFFHHDPF
jgi:hypothetical protein